jgi:cytochrome c oxidase subunit IV
MKEIPSDTKKIRKDKALLILSLFVFLYFAFLILIYELKYDAVIIGVFREMLTIPFMVLLVILLVLSTITFIKEKFKIKSYTFYSLIILLFTLSIMVAFA